MTDKNIALNISIFPTTDSDAYDLFQSTTDLDRELHDINEVDDVILPSAPGPEEGARAGIDPLFGQLLVAVATAAVPQLISAVTNWVKRQRTSGSVEGLQIANGDYVLVKVTSDQSYLPPANLEQLITSYASTAPFTVAELEQTHPPGMFRQLHAALLDAYDVNSFAGMLRIEVDKRLDLLTSLQLGFVDVVTNVLLIAEREGWIDDLVAGAVRHNPTNKRLHAFYEEFQATTKLGRTESLEQTEPTAAPSKTNPQSAAFAAHRSANIHALLIGINHYLPNTLPGGASYGHLHGCVQDVERMEAFLKTHLGIEAAQIIKLTASHGDNGPAEDESVWPTYANIVAGLQRLAAQAQPGEQVIIHYSGHGGRATSIYPTAVKPSQIDEALVPVDIGQENGRYVRDLELAYLLQQLTEKELVVTVILDCCHSGGLTRGDAVARGIGVVDTTQRPTDTLAAPTTEILLSAWQQLASTTRSTEPIAVGGLPANPNWVVLSACRPQELAYETKFDGFEKSGALTHWLLDSLAAGGAALSYKQLHQRVQARVQAQFTRQRPQLFGAGDRVVFGREQMQTQFAASVLTVDEARREIVLNVGVVQGVRRGAQFSVFPLAATSLRDFDDAMATVTIVGEGTTESRARIDTLDEGRLIEPGAQAVLFNPSSVQLRSSVKLQTDGEGALPEAAASALYGALETAHSGRFIELADMNEAADFIVAAAGDDYVLWDAGGERIPRLNPRLALGDPASAAKLIERLIHLTRYRNVQQLANSDSRTRGAPQITMEWLDVAADHVFNEGDQARLLVRNDSGFEVDITILALEEDWRIAQIYPEGSAEAYTFAPGETDTLEFDVYLEGDGDTETTLYKLFGTVQGTNFRMLELPSLDAPVTRGSFSPRTELEALLSQVVETTPKTRAGRLRSRAAREWTTAQVEMVVKRVK